MASEFHFGSTDQPKQAPSVNQKPTERVDYSLPLVNDDDYMAKRDPDPLKTYSLKILRGRKITIGLCILNILVLLLSVVLSLSSDDSNIWWPLGYGGAMILCCIFMIPGREWARKFFAIPALLIGVPVSFVLIVSPSSIPMFLKSSYQMALQMVSAAMLYFLPSATAWFQATPKARRRAIDHEWEKKPSVQDK